MGCNIYASGPVGMVCAIGILVMPVTYSLLTKEKPLYSGLVCVCLLLLSLAGYALTINRRSYRRPMHRPKRRRML
jgi:predicted tellurium resistance membrane protein TerC